jgi:hypothetical protein
VEPAQRLRTLAGTLHPQAAITWMDDSLPGLANISTMHMRFDLVWLSAVWMHVEPDHRQAAFDRIVALLKPGGRIMLTLRQGPFPDNRVMYATPVDEIEMLAARHGLSIVYRGQTGEGCGSDTVNWRAIFLQASA